MNLQELTERIHSIVPIGKPTVSHLSVTGETYVTLAVAIDRTLPKSTPPDIPNSIVKEETEACRVLPRFTDKSDSDLCDAFYLGFLEYLNTACGNITLADLNRFRMYIREPVNILDIDGDIIRIRMRVLISDKPELGTEEG